MFRRIVVRSNGCQRDGSGNGIGAEFQRWHEDGLSSVRASCLSFKGSVLHVVSGDVTVDYPLDQVWKHTFEEVEASAVTERHAGVGVVRVVGNQVRFSGLPSGQAVSVYSADGRQVACYRVGGDGCGELSLQACPAGLYVIKYGKSTLKIMKR